MRIVKRIDERTDPHTLTYKQKYICYIVYKTDWGAGYNFLLEDNGTTYVITDFMITNWQWWEIVQ